MQRGRVSHPVFARFYARLTPAMDQGGLADLRRQLVAGLSGRVIEVGAGDGANFRHYPADVSLLAVEPEPYLRRRAVQAATAAEASIEIVEGVAENLPVDDGGVDAAVASLVLCSVASQRTVLGELHRVIRPGGQLRFLEHVRAESRAMRGVQRMLDATIWPVLFGGDRTGRDTASAIEEAGFTIEWLERPRFPDSRVSLPTSAHVLGGASRSMTDLDQRTP
ncbi:MAG: class I SAM-dependent methyltransferase [Jiangellaceae bacterium]